MRKRQTKKNIKNFISASEKLAYAARVSNDSLCSLSDAANKLSDFYKNNQ